MRRAAALVACMIACSSHDAPPPSPPPSSQPSPPPTGAPLDAAGPPLGTRDSFDRWLATDEPTLPYRLPDFGSAACAAQLPAARLHYAFYAALLDRDLAMTLHMLTDGPPLALRGSVQRAFVQTQVYWTNGTFTREGRVDDTHVPYRGELGMQLIHDGPLDGTVEAVATAGPSELTPDVLWWIDGQPIAMMRAKNLLPAGTRTYAQLESGWTSCTFTDRDGHAFAGGAAHELPAIEAAWGPRQARVELVRLGIDGGEGSPGHSGVVTAIERLAPDVARMDADARASLGRRIARERAAGDDLLARVRGDAEQRAAKRAPSDARATRDARTGVPGTIDARYVWSEHAQQLTIVLAYWRGDRWSRFYTVPTRQVCPRGAPCVERANVEEVRDILDYGIELASVTTYAADGTLVDTRELPLREAPSLPTSP